MDRRGETGCKSKTKKFRVKMKTRSPEVKPQYTIARKKVKRVEKKRKNLAACRQIRMNFERDLHGIKKLLYSLAKITEERGVKGICH